jgi:glycosyltransferase involved in cell wall biosynthesis
MATVSSKKPVFLKRPLLHQPEVFTDGKPTETAAMPNITQPLISVRMLSYNQAPYIAQAIEGALQQQVDFPIELVIGDDCSTDGTREIVLEYQRKHPSIVRVITSETRVGIKQNAYRTNKACRGKYIAFCDGDDYWHIPEKLKKQTMYLESHPECGLILADCNEYHQSSERLLESRNYSNGFTSDINLNIETILMNIGVTKYTSSAVARSNLVNQLIDSDSYLYHNPELLMGDTQLWAEISTMSTVTYIPKTFATHRVLEESASRSRDPLSKLRFWKSVYEMRIYVCKKYNLPSSLIMKTEAAWCDVALTLALNERNPALAAKVLRVKPCLTFKEKLKYQATSNAVVYYALWLYSKLLRKKVL